MVRTQPADAKVSLEVGKSTYPIHPQYPEAGSWKLEAGSWKLEAGSWKLEAGSSGIFRIIIYYQ